MTAETTAAPTLAGILRAGLAWLYDTPQPDDAILRHHGVTAPAVGNRRLSFCPAGHDGRPVIVLNVAKWTWNERNEPTDTITVAEFARLAAAISDHGRNVADTWNGPGLVTGSIALTPDAHPTLRAAVARYRAGCPEHGSVFCHSNTPPCPWYRDGHARIVQPTWPEETR